MLSDGSLASLVACAIACDHDDTPPSVMLARVGDAFDRARQSAVAEQCERYDLARVELAGECVVDPASPGPGLSSSMLAIAHGAVAHGHDRVIWPVHLGLPTLQSGPIERTHDDEPETDRPEDLDALADLCDRAVLAARLASLDADPRAQLTIDTPLIDLSDSQLGELALDLAVPVTTCWWWNPGKAGDHLPARLYRRWTAALHELGWTTAETL